MTSTATIEAPQSRRKSTMMSEARMMPIRMASRTLVMDCGDDLGLVVERPQLDARRQRLLHARDLGMDLVSHSTVLLSG